MKIEGLDIQEQDNMIVACIRHDDGNKSVTFFRKDEEGHGFLKWFWNMIQVEGHKGSFEKEGSWR